MIKKTHLCARLPEKKLQKDQFPESKPSPVAVSP